MGHLIDYWCKGARCSSVVVSTSNAMGHLIDSWCKGARCSSVVELLLIVL